MYGRLFNWRAAMVEENEPLKLPKHSDRHFDRLGTWAFDLSIGT